MDVPATATHAHVETTFRLSLPEWAAAAHLDVGRLHPIVPRYDYEDGPDGFHAALHCRLPTDQKVRDHLLAALDCLSTKVSGALRID
jgi:hypothetical protein